MNAIHDQERLYVLEAEHEEHQRCLKQVRGNANEVKVQFAGRQYSAPTVFDARRLDEQMDDLNAAQQDHIQRIEEGLEASK